MRLGVGFEEKQRDWEVKVGACGLGGLSFQLRLSRRRWKDADVSLFSPAWVRAPQGLRPDLGPRPGRPRGPRCSPPAPQLPLHQRRRGRAESPAGAAAAAVPSHLLPARASPRRAPAAAALPRASEPASERARPARGPGRFLLATAASWGGLRPRWQRLSGAEPAAARSPRAPLSPCHGETVRCVISATADRGLRGGQDLPAMPLHRQRVPLLAYLYHR